MSNNYFSVNISKHADNAYWVELESFRPPNAPRGRYTKADMNRRKKAAESNYKRSKRENFFTFDEALEEAKKLLAPGHERNT